MVLALPLTIPDKPASQLELPPLHPSLRSIMQVILSARFRPTVRPD
jgi:hypothetical protein